jgi:uncharacterized protein (TIGR00251 family)
MIAVQLHAQGVILPVWARPGSKENELVDEHNGALRVAVTARPEGGRANESIIRVLADGLNLRIQQIALLSGASSRSKRFLIQGIRAEDLISRIEAALDPTLFEAPEADV